jgi:hypothetical protein
MSSHKEHNGHEVVLKGSAAFVGGFCVRNHERRI